MSQGVTKLEDFNVPSGMISLNEASSLLLEKLKEVSKNPAEIDSALCMVQIAGRVCDMAKAQVEQAKVINELLRTKQGI